MSEDRRDRRGDDGGRDRRDRGVDRRDDRGADRRGREAGRRDERGRPRRDDRDVRDRRGGDRREERGRRAHERGGREGREGDRPRRREDERAPRYREPEVPEGIEARQLDKALRSELLTLSKDNADGTARHLVAAGLAVEEEDLDTALAHAQAAARRAGRVAGVRETLGVVHYRRGEWAKALSEFRTARRLSGQDHLLPLIADTERGLGRPERALELAASPEAGRLDPAGRIEMAIVVSGARVDMGQTAAAVQHLRDLVRHGSPRAPWAARLRYAYAAALEADGRGEEAQEWFAQAAQADAGGETDAAELLGLPSEPEIIDLGGDESDEDGAGRAGEVHARRTAGGGGDGDDGGDDDGGDDDGDEPAR